MYKHRNISSTFNILHIKTLLHFFTNPAIVLAIQIISITAFAGRKSNAHFQKNKKIKFANPLSLTSKDHIGIGLCALCLEMV